MADVCLDHQAHIWSSCCGGCSYGITCASLSSLDSAIVQGSTSREHLACQCLSILAQAAKEAAARPDTVELVCKACQASSAALGQPAGSTRTAALQAVEALWQHSSAGVKGQLLEVRIPAQLSFPTHAKHSRCFLLAALQAGHAARARPAQQASMVGSPVQVLLRSAQDAHKPARDKAQHVLAAVELPAALLADMLQGSTPLAGSLPVCGWAAACSGRADDEQTQRSCRVCCAPGASTDCCPNLACMTWEPASPTCMQVHDSWQVMWKCRLPSMLHHSPVWEPCTICCCKVMLRQAAPSNPSDQPPHFRTHSNLISGSHAPQSSFNPLCLWQVLRHLAVWQPWSCCSSGLCWMEQPWCLYWLSC